jgi:hypothetical protein
MHHTRNLWGENMQRPSRSIKLRRRKAGKKSRKIQNNSRLVIMREPGRFMPDRLQCKLRFMDTTVKRSSAALSPVMNWTYRSSAYDPDPAFLTGAIPGFTELAALYREYRVNSITGKIGICNQNAESCILCVWPSNGLNSANTLLASDVLEYVANPRGQMKILGNNTGTSTNEVNSTASGMQLVGPIFKTDLNYSSPTNANPALNYYLNIGIVNTQGNFAFPVGTAIQLVYDIEFFKITQLEI